MEKVKRDKETKSIGWFKNLKYIPRLILEQCNNFGLHYTTQSFYLWYYYYLE